MSPRVHERRRRRALAAVSVVAIAGAALWIGVDGPAAGGGDGGHGSPSETAPSTARVARRDLVEREDVDGTLGYAGSRRVTNGLRGTLTRMRAEGETVRRGQWLYEVDGKPSAWLMYGGRPAWRAFAAGMADGDDVRQLERNLQALGHDPYGAIRVDDEFTAATAASVKRFQRARGMKADGRLEVGDVVFLPGSARVRSRRASIGMRLQPGQDVLQTTSGRLVVTVDLAVSRRSLVSTGDRVRVELPDGSRARGRISAIGRIAKPGGEEEEATIEVTVVLGSRTTRKGFDQSPVSVGITQQARRDALSVPVTALLALEGGGSGVEVVQADGSRRIVHVTTGLFAGGYVEISGAAVREGMTVVVPDAI